MKKLFLMILAAGWAAVTSLAGSAGVWAQEDAGGGVIQVQAQVTEAKKEPGDDKAKKEEGEETAPAGPAAIVIPARKPVETVPAEKAKKNPAPASAAVTVKNNSAAATPKNASDTIKSATERVKSSFESNFQKIYGMPSSGNKDSASKS